jgi:hypothetical protein
MGGQACRLYGAAESSRDTDFAILASSANLRWHVLSNDVPARPCESQEDSTPQGLADASPAIEADYFNDRENPTRQRMTFWFLELRHAQLRRA